MHDPNPIMYAATVLGYVYGQTELAADQLHAYGETSAATATEMAHGML